MPDKITPDQWHIQQVHDHVTALTAERDRLREQVSNLNRVIREGGEANRLLQANNDRLREALETANSQFEEFERRYYLESDKVESVRAVNAELVAVLEQAHNKLMNLQPHIPQACDPRRVIIVDAYVDEAMSVLGAALKKAGR